MVTIRLNRGGAKKRPYYNIVVTDSRNKRDGRFIEQVGYYNPMADEAGARARIDLERVDYWLGHGAKTSERVAKIVEYARSAA